MNFLMVLCSFVIAILTLQPWAWLLFIVLFLLWFFGAFDWLDRATPRR